MANAVCQTTSAATTPSGSFSHLPTRTHDVPPARKTIALSTRSLRLPNNAAFPTLISVYTAVGGPRRSRAGSPERTSARPALVFQFGSYAVPGKFVISLDMELMWGVRDKSSKEQYGHRVLGEREAIPAMLD